ncbi:MAG: hypothetical protein JWM16_1881 [Verrucomicrobiales bacterium]|nr:hypothetical protein [Verrucomicrobiales bacterium]
MTVLELRFPAGRYHATPWGRHVNEGAVEWPPSPWRLLRTLIATWYLKARPEVTEESLRSLISSLAAQPPHFYLPKATSSHTRHYLPIVEGKNEKTTKVFDTFIQVDPKDSVMIAWDAVLPADQIRALQILALRIGYFGRAESLVEARVRGDIAQINPNASPLSDGKEIPNSSELVRLLSPLPDSQYDLWRTDFLAKNSAPAGSSFKSSAKKSPPKKAKTPDVPADLFAALQADTGALQAAGWNLPPGAAFVNYLRPADSFAPAPRAPQSSRESNPTVARYAVVSKVPPRITQALFVADKVHDALCKWSDQGNGPAEVFSGVNQAGNPLTGHQHAHIFCEAQGPRDVISHLTVWCPSGFDERASLALRRLNRIWGHGGHDLRLVLIGLGTRETFPDCTLFGSSTIWTSLTPFVPTRHAKTFRDGRPKIDAATGCQVGSAGHDLLRFLSLEPNKAGAEVRQLKNLHLGNCGTGRTLRAIQFQTLRHHGGGMRGSGEGAFFSITFPQSVTGPLALGYASHFGLGLFVPVTLEKNS